MTSWLWILLAVALVAAVCWPRRGLLARARASRERAARVLREDALKHLLKAEANGEASNLASVAGALHLGPRRTAGVLADLEHRRLLEFRGGRFRLTRAARELALHIIRAHRLWESYLAEKTGWGEAEWHRQAERQEHQLSPQQTRELEAALGHPTRDPHGDAIPPAGEELPAEPVQRLSDVPAGQTVTITHVEDEPPELYRQLSAAGLRPGVRACVLDKSPAGLRLWAEGTEHFLEPLPAQNIAVSPLEDVRPRELLAEEYLVQLRPGQRAVVLGLSPACRGPERRRLLDLGFVPGSEVVAEMASPLGDPVAYRVRGAVVALRRNQAAQIRVRIEKPTEQPLAA